MNLIHCFFKVKNYGVIAKSRNFGILKSKGKFIAFLDSDDIWMEEKLYECNKIITRNPKIKFIYHNMYVKKNLENIYSKKVKYFRTLFKPINSEQSAKIGPVTIYRELILPQFLTKASIFFQTPLLNEGTCGLILLI